MAPEVQKGFELAALSWFDVKDIAWARSGDALYFRGTSHSVTNLWKVSVDPKTLRWIKGPERLTTGPGRDTDIALTPDGSKLALTTRVESTRIWSFPVDASQGRIIGRGEPVTVAGVNAWLPDLTRDGKRLAFGIQRGGTRELWQKSLVDGRETMLYNATSFWSPRWSPDATQLAYGRQNPRGGGWSIVSMPVEGGNERVLASATPVEGSVDLVQDWSPDGKSILASCLRGKAARYQIWSLPLAAAPHAETKARLVTFHPDYNLFEAHMSPNGRWIAFNAVKSVGTSGSTIYVVPASGGNWVRVTEDQYWSDKPRWSPDGKTIYFVSSRGGFFNVWGRRFDPLMGSPVGEAFRITNFNNPGQMIPDRLRETRDFPLPRPSCRAHHGNHRQHLDAGKRGPLTAARVRIMRSDPRFQDLLRRMNFPP